MSDFTESSPEAQAVKRAYLEFARFERHHAMAGAYLFNHHASIAVYDHFYKAVDRDGKSLIRAVVDAIKASVDGKPECDKPTVINELYWLWNSEQLRYWIRSALSLSVDELRKAVLPQYCVKQCPRCNCEQQFIKRSAGSMWRCLECKCGIDSSDDNPDPLWKPEHYGMFAPRWTFKNVDIGDDWVTDIEEPQHWIDWFGDKTPEPLSEQEELRVMPYDEYLRTDHWATVRSAALEAAGHRCQVCNSSSSLHVHHRTYERRGNEAPSDLTVLCAGCHKLFHDNGKLAGGAS